MSAQRISRRALLQATSAGMGALVLAACVVPATPGTPSQQTQSEQAAPSTEGVTLTYWAVLNANVAATLKNFNGLTCYQELEKITGVHLDFQHVPNSPQATETFNLMIASGQLPDIIETNWLTFPGGPAKALNDEIVISLTEIVDSGKSPNIKKMFEDHSDWHRMVITNEGELYCYPALRGDDALQTFCGPAIRQDYLDKVGSDVPTTIDEWTSMLAKFKGQDLNGNGNADEYGLTSWLLGKGILGFTFSHAFIGAWGMSMGYYNDGGTVKYGPLQPAYKDFLQTLVDWNKAGYFHPDNFTMDAKAFDAQTTGGNIASSLLFVGPGIGRITALARPHNPDFKLVGAPYPSHKAGEKAAFGQTDGLYPGVLSPAITTACKNVDAAVKVLDYGYGEAGHMLFNFGVEGLTYTMKEGYPTYTDLIMRNPDKLPLAQSMAQHIRANFGGPFVQDARYLEQYFTLPEQKAAFKTWADAGHDKIMPPVTPDQAESRKYGRIMSDITPRYEEVFAKIVSGTEPIESWDAFVGELDTLGIQQALSVQQVALEQFNKRA